MNEDRARTGVNEEDFVVAFRAACDALAGAGVPYLFMGGIASIVHGRTSWTHDLDVFIRRADEPTTVEALVGAGYRLDPNESSWFSKLWMNDVFLDVIYSSTGPVELDDDMLERERAEVWGREIPRARPGRPRGDEGARHGEETMHYWWDALAIIAKRESTGTTCSGGRRGPRADPERAAVRAVDRPRGARPRHPPAGVGNAGKRRSRPKPGASPYLAEHLHEALLSDQRVGEQDLQVWRDEHCIHVAGTVPTPARRDAIARVVRELAPGWGICNDDDGHRHPAGPE